jgi:S1-C subfamily serine protease
MKYLLFLSLLSLSSSYNSLLPEENRVISIYNESVNSVVNVSTKSLISHFFYDKPLEVPQGVGSGFLWDDKHIVTNYHVVSGASSFYIRFPKNNKEYSAKFIGGDEYSDLAVLKIEEKPSYAIPLKLGDSKSVQVGQIALAIGSPYGLDFTLTKGIISALDRSLPFSKKTFQEGFIQIDSPVNPGNSGGPCINSNGEVIGINTVIASKTGSNVGLGFVLPINTAKKIVPQLIAKGFVRRPSLGLVIFKAPFFKQGLVIAEVPKNSPGEKVGIQACIIREGSLIPRDILTHLNDKEISSLEDLNFILSQVEVGQEVTLTLLNSNLSRKVKITLE